MLSVVSGEEATESPQTELATKAVQVNLVGQYEGVKRQKWAGDWTVHLIVPLKVKKKQFCTFCSKSKSSMFQIVPFSKAGLILLNLLKGAANMGPHDEASAS